MKQKLFLCILTVIILFMTACSDETQYLVKIYNIDGETIYSEMYKKGDLVSEPELKYNFEYMQFSGWYSKIDGIETKWDFKTDTVKSDLTLLPRWKFDDGYLVYHAKTDSMKGTNVDSFDKNTRIIVKKITDEEKRSLKAGDVIAYYTIINGQKETNTHRIVQVIDAGGINAQYITKGDNAQVRDPGEVFWTEIIGIYHSKMNASILNYLI